MSLGLLFPLGLLALAAWLVPLLIHLARRQHDTPLEFAALRWLRAKARPRQRIRFDQWPLLLVRLLLLAALALLLARPLLHGGAADTHPVTVVAPGLDGAALRGDDRDGDWRWLAPGFPALQAASPAAAQPLASLLRDAGDLPVLEQRTVGAGRLLRFTAPLVPAELPVLREATFPQRLLAIIRPATAPQLAMAGAHTPLTGAAAPLAQPRELAPWLLLAIVLLFALERWLATAPRRRASA